MQPPSYGAGMARRYTTSHADAQPRTRRGLGRLRGSRSLHVPDVPLQVFAVDQRQDLEPVPLDRPVDQPHVGRDADAVVAGEAFERDGTEARVPPVLAQPRDLLERAAHDAAVPPADRIVELVAEDRHAPDGAGRRRLRRALDRRRPRRARLLQRAEPRGELLIAGAQLVELRLERAGLPLGRVELLAETRHLGRRARLEPRAERLALLRELVALAR